MIYDSEKTFPLISVIIPVYKVEKYLDKCITSVATQTYTNLEIILIDDGSPDKCPAICDAWKECDSRVKVIHRKNGGLSVARNDGLKLATGDFIGFVDSDDWIDSKMYEVLLAAIRETNSDIAVCNYHNESSDLKNVKNKIQTYEKFLFSSEEALRYIVSDKSFISTSVWNKLYKKNILLNSNFPEGKICEDILWTAEIVGKAKSLICIDSCLYHYTYQRSESLSNDGNIIRKRLLDQIDLFEKRKEYIIENFPNLKEITILKFQEFCYELYLISYKNKFFFDKEGNIRRELHRHYRKAGFFVIWDIEKINIKIAHILFWICPRHFVKIYYFISKNKIKLVA